MGTRSFWPKRRRRAYAPARPATVKSDKKNPLLFRQKALLQMDTKQLHRELARLVNFRDPKMRLSGKTVERLKHFLLMGDSIGLPMPKEEAVLEIIAAEREAARNKFIREG